MAGIEILGIGNSKPRKVVTNDDLSKIVDTSDEWITTRTGIKKRNFCVEEKNMDLAYEAASKAIESSGISTDDIGLLIVATFTPDNASPSVSCMIQNKLGLGKDVMTFDINAACSGFLYSLETARAILNQINEDKKNKKYAIVVGSEQISTRLNMEDRGSCVLFGDGAGAVVIGLSDNKKYYSIMGADGKSEALGCTGIQDGKPHVYMDGKQVFKTAVRTMTSVVKELLCKSQWDMGDIDYIVCHQANERIIDTVVRTLKAPAEKFYMNIADYGNTSAASIPIAISEMNEKGILKKGMKVMFVGFGSGFTWGGILMEI